MQKVLDTDSRRGKIGLFIFAVLVLLPALDYSGFLGKSSLHITKNSLYILCCAGGILSLFVLASKRIIANLICGPMLGAGVCFATIVYLQSRTHILKIELLVPLLLGLVPGAIIYYLLVLRFYANDLPGSDQPPATGVQETKE